MTAELRAPRVTNDRLTSATVAGEPRVGETLSLSQQLAGLVAGTRPADVPESVIRTAAWWVLDWLGAAIAGLDSAPGRIMLEHTAAQPDGIASCIGMGETRSTQVAALHNGAISHVVEMDDVHRAAVIHPAVVIVPA